MKSPKLLFALLAAILVCASLSAQTLQLETTQSLSDLELTLGAAPVEIDLRDSFDIDGVTGQIVELAFNKGIINIEMLANDAPLNVANFLNYVDDGDYDNSIIHRLIPEFVAQGGGFTAELPTSPLPTDDPVVNEFSLSNQRGTLSMAKLANDPDSATSSFFINLNDNSENLDVQNEGFTVFSRVIGTGMDVADLIEVVPTWTVTLDAGGFPFEDVPLEGGVNDPVSVDLMIVLNTAKRVEKYPAEGIDSMLSFAVEKGAGLEASVELQGSTLVVDPGESTSSAGSVTVTATDSNGNEQSLSFNVTVVSEEPFFTTRPLSRAVVLGRPVTLSANAFSETEATYQWKKDGVAITGATQTTYSIDSFESGDAGIYALSATNTNGTSESMGGELTAIDMPAELVNLSTRGFAGAGEQALIAGFFAGGSAGNMDLLIRGLGPALTARGVTGAMPDPRLRLVPIAGDEVFNDDWDIGNDLGLVDAFSQRSGAAELENGSADALIIGSYPVSGYTALITPKGDSSEGVVLAEVFDADVDTGASPARLVNISTRAFVGEGDRVLIAGFYVVGGEKATLLIRALGPELANRGVTGFLSDPQLRVVDELGNDIAVSDNWGDSPFKDSLIRETENLSATVPAEGSLDASTIVTLDPGGYSVIVSGVGGATGVGLVEIFEMQ